MKFLMRTFYCTLFLTFTMVLPIAAIGPIFGPSRVSDSIVLYDTDGGVGWVAVSNDGTTGQQPHFEVDFDGSGELYIDDDYLSPLVSFDELSITFATGSNGIPEFPGGTPYYIRRFHPDLGCFSTFGYVGAQFNESWPVIVVPVSFGKYGIPNRVVDSEDNGSEALSVIMGSALIADDPTTMSLGVLSFNLFKSLAVEERPLLSVSVAFLPGNSQSGTVNWRPLQYLDFFQLHWGDPLPGGPRPTVLEMGTPAPAGPILVSFSYDGYSTDTITLNVEKTKAYYWRPVLKSITGPTPTGYNPNAGILDQGVADALLGECNPSATLRIAWDPNQDGKTDAADFTTPDPTP